MIFRQKRHGTNCDIVPRAKVIVTHEQLNNLAMSVNQFDMAMNL